MANIKPTEKVQAGGYAGSAAIVLLWIAGQLGLDVPPEIAGAFVLLLSGAAAWIKREGAGWIKSRNPPGRHAANAGDLS